MKRAGGVCACFLWAMTGIGFMATLSGSVFAQAEGQRGPDKRLPNMLFVLSDDHSYPFLSCYGDANVKTPNLDRLASEGIKFHRFFTAAPQCVPSRAALLTGRSPAAARISRFSSPLARDVITFPELLRKEAGYYVGVCGRSYHLDGSTGKGADAKEVGALLQKHGLKTFAERFDYVNTGNDSEAIKQMEEFLDGRPKDKPFFLWLNFSDPHHVWKSREDEPDPASLKLPAHWPDLPGMRGDLAAYCGEVNRLDRSVQSALELLKKRGAEADTLIVFCGDNGLALPHGKGSLYDPGLNVPCIVRWPGVVRPGGESRVLISGEDLGPTLLSAAGVPVPERMSGVSFLPLLRGEPFEGRTYLFAERGPHGSASVTADMKNSGYDLSRCVRSDRYKLIYNCTPWLPYSPVDSAGDASWKEMTAAKNAGALAPALTNAYFSAPRPVYELYDLEADPSELANLSGKPEHASVEGALRLALAENMILNFDYLPLPAMLRRDADGTKKARDAGGREGQFEQKDQDHNGRLSKAEFAAGREPADAEKWFGLRDRNADGFLSREEFLSGAQIKP